MEGIFGLSVDSGKYKGNFLYDLGKGTFYQQHLQDESSGLAVCGGKEIRRDNHPGQFRFKNFSGILSGFPGREGIGYCGESSVDPLLQSSRLGEFAISFSGNMINRERLKNELERAGCTFDQESNSGIDSGIIAKLISQAEDFVGGIRIAMEKIKGSFVVLILTPSGIYAARSPLGRWELIMGKKKGAVVVSCDPCGFDNLGFKIFRGLEPAEVIVIENGRIKKVEKFSIASLERMSGVCSFLPVYTRFPNEMFGEGPDAIPVSVVRERLGANSARRDIESGFIPDIVTWVPDSGTTHFVGYINEFISASNSGEIDEDKAPICKEIFYKYSHAGRSFTPSTEEEGEWRSQTKLLTSRENFEGMTVVVVDDSLVRGRQSRKLLQILRFLGFAGVHFRFSFPKIYSYCPWGKTTKKGELLAARFSTEEAITDFFEIKGVEISVGFNEISELVNAIGLPREKLCVDCCLR